MKQERSRLKGVARKARCPRRAPDNIKQKIDHCKEIRLALLPPGIATCPQYCIFLPTVLTNLLVVTTQHISYRALIRSIAQLAFSKYLVGL
jgi:hypothetical protein